MGSYTSKINQLNDVIHKQNIIIKELTEKSFCHDYTTNKSHTKTYTSLVFSGGAVKGYAYIGAIKELHSRGHLKNITNFAGTSIGSMVASLLAIGLSMDDMENVMKKLDLAKFFQSGGIINDVYNFYEAYGIYTGDYIMDFIGEVMQKKTGNKDYTLKQLYDDTKVTLVIVSTNLNKKIPIYFHHANVIPEYANIPIRLAVRLSCSLPFIFQAEKYNCDYFIDGGTLDNYPIHVFDGDVPGDAKYITMKPNESVLGLSLFSLNDYKEITNEEEAEINHINQYCSNIIELLFVENQKKIFTPMNICRTVNIITPNYPLNTFSLTPKQIEELIECGTKYVCHFFDGNK